MRYNVDAASHLEPLSPDGSPTRPRGYGRNSLTARNVGSILASTTLMNLRRRATPAPGRRPWAWRDTFWMVEEYVHTMGFPDWDCVVPHTGTTEIAVSDTSGQNVSARR